MRALGQGDRAYGGGRRRRPAASLHSSKERSREASSRAPAGCAGKRLGKGLEAHGCRVPPPHLPAAEFCLWHPLPAVVLPAGEPERAVAAVTVRRQVIGKPAGHLRTKKEEERAFTHLPMPRGFKERRRSKDRHLVIDSSQLVLVGGFGFSHPHPPPPKSRRTRILFLQNRPHVDFSEPQRKAQQSLLAFLRTRQATPATHNDTTG